MRWQVELTLPEMQAMAGSMISHVSALVHVRNHFIVRAQFDAGLYDRLEAVAAALRDGDEPRFAVSWAEVGKCFENLLGVRSG